MFDVISIGDSTQDIFLEMSPENAHLHTVRHAQEEICFNFAAKIPVKSKHDSVGGNSSNAAVAFGRLGFNVAFYTHVGEDAPGRRVIEALTENKVATDYVIVDKGTETNYNTVINLEGERTILVYHIQRHFSLPKLAPASWVYLSSMSKGFETILPDLAEYLDHTKAKVCFQPGTYQLHYGAERMSEILQRTEIFSVNREEAETYLHAASGTPMRILLDKVRELGPKIALISDGKAGAYVSDGTTYLHLGVVNDIPRVDSTGAGDAFASGFMAARMSGKSLEEALQWGHAESSSVIQYIGPQAGLLRKSQLRDLLARYSFLRATLLVS